MKKVVSFDFDGTMCYTPEPESGKVFFKNITGVSWPHQGWWGRGESLDLDVFQIPLNTEVYTDYLEHLSDTDSYVVLATGRLNKLKKEVQKVLDLYELEFDEVHCNPGMDTFLFKKRLFENLISTHNPDSFIMYDDRQEHLDKFGDWATTQNCQIIIIDVVNKTQKIYNN